MEVKYTVEKWEKRRRVEGPKAQKRELPSKNVVPSGFPSTNWPSRYTETSPPPAPETCPAPGPTPPRALTPRRGR